MIVSGEVAYLCSGNGGPVVINAADISFEYINEQLSGDYTIQFYQLIGTDDYPRSYSEGNDTVVLIDGVYTNAQ